MISQDLQNTTTQEDYDSFNKALSSGNYQGAYNLGKARGFDDTAIASYAANQLNIDPSQAAAHIKTNLNTGLGSIFSNTPQNQETLLGQLAGSYHQPAVGMNSDAFRSLATSATSPEQYWTGMANLSKPAANTLDSYISSTSGAPYSQNAANMNNIARSQYLGNRMTPDQFMSDEHGKSVGWSSLYGLNNLSGLSQDALIKSGVQGIPSWYLESQGNMRDLAAAADPQAYLNKIRDSYYQNPAYSASTGMSSGNDMQWQQMLKDMNVIKDPTTGYTYGKSGGNYYALNDYGHGRSINLNDDLYANTGMNADILRQLQAGGGTKGYNPQATPAGLVDMFKNSGSAYPEYTSYYDQNRPGWNQPSQAVQNNPNVLGTQTNSTQTNGNLAPRRTWNQSFNRGSRYFSPNTGGYTNQLNTGTGLQQLF